MPVLNNCRWSSILDPSVTDRRECSSGTVECFAPWMPNRWQPGAALSRSRLCSRWSRNVEIVGTREVSADGVRRVWIAVRRCRGSRARPNSIYQLPVRVVLRDAARGGPLAFAVAHGIDSCRPDSQGCLALQRSVLREATGVHRHRFVYRSFTRRTLACLSAVLRVDAVSLIAPGLPGSPLPTDSSWRVGGDFRAAISAVVAVARPASVPACSRMACCRRSWNNRRKRCRPAPFAICKSSGFKTSLIERLLRKLTRLVERLEWSPPRTQWTNYDNSLPHVAEDRQAKSAFVRKVCRFSSARSRLGPRL